MSPDSPQPVLTNKPLARINNGKRTVDESRISPPATYFFAYWTVVLGFFQLNIKASHEI